MKRHPLLCVLRLSKIGSSNSLPFQLESSSASGRTPSLPRGGMPGVGAPSFDISRGLTYAGTENGEVFAVEAPY